MNHVSDLFQNKDKFLKNLPSDSFSTLPPENPTPPLSTVPPFSSATKEVRQEPDADTEPEQTPAVPNDPSKAELIRYTLYKIKDQVDILLHLLDETTALLPSAPLQVIKTPAQTVAPDKNGRILEGIFTGEKMLSDEGEIFTIPANYASKSKLVEGDRMKLTIPENGSFIYKQISPIERKRIRGELVSGGTNGQWMVNAEGRSYKVLTASITFHKGRIGDEVVLLVPESGMSDWGAVEHIIHKEF